MKYLSLIAIASFFLTSCSNKSHLVYLSGSDNNPFDQIDYANFNNSIEPGDILNIKIQSLVPEASLPYNINNTNTNLSQNLDMLKLEGFLVDEFFMINYPIIGKINVESLSVSQLEKRITNLLLDGGHLINFTANVKRINAKFTVLGEVRMPGTFSYFDENLNIFQALGYAGDLTIEGKRKNITIIREENGLRKIRKIDLTDLNIIFEPYYQIKNNDIIIVDPNYSKIKSAGFIGSPASFASISSLLLSITLLIVNR